MNHRRHLCVALFSLSLLISLAACKPAEPESESTAIPLAEAEITCEVYYRAAAGGALEAGPELVFSGENEEQSAPFDDLLFIGRYTVDAGEGRAFAVAVSDAASGTEIARSLYQLSPDGLRNQFIGGHGFTGLVYIFHPSAAAEMQYFCQVR